MTTQKELIEKWREEAKERRKDANGPWGHINTERQNAKADALEECADDLEALTYG